MLHVILVKQRLRMAILQWYITLKNYINHLNPYFIMLYIIFKVQYTAQKAQNAFTIFIELAPPETCR